MNRRRYILKSAAAMVCLCSGLSSGAKANEVVTVGLQLGAMGALKVQLPELGKKHGVTFDINNFNDSTTALLALEQGAVQVVNTTSQHLTRAISENIDVVWIMGWGGGNNVIVSASSINLAPDDIPALRDLVAERKRAGRPVKIGTATGSMEHLNLIYFLRSIGVDEEKDVNIVNVPFPVHPRALEAGEIDLAVTLPVFASIAIVNGSAKHFRHLFGGEYGKSEVGYIVLRKLIKEKPELVQAVVNTMVEAMNAFVDDTAKHIELEMKESSLPKAALELQLGTYEPVNYRTDMGDLKKMARQMHELGWVKKDYTSEVEKHVDLSFLAKATGRPISELSRW
jgi:NitT/TauT family transport system substrate-binding protein